MLSDITSWVFKVGACEGVYDDGTVLDLSAVEFGSTSRYIVTARGHLRSDLRVLEEVTARLLRRAAERQGTSAATGVPGIIQSVGDALTALRLAVEARKGIHTRLEWWRWGYSELVVREHRRHWPGTAVQNPFDAARLEAANTVTPAPVVSLWQVRNQRQEAERIAAAAVIAAKRERQRIARELKVEGDGQVAAAF